MPHPELSELITDVREQVLFLQELGVDAMAVEFRVPSPKSQVQSPKSVTAPTEIQTRIAPARETVAKAAPGSRLAALPSLSNRPRSAPLESSGAFGPLNSSDMNKNVSAASELLIDIAPRLEETADTIESIRSEIGPDCTRCKLGTLGRKQVVNSTGNFNAQLMFVGEAPGADEDEQGFPFVGRAGQLLTKIIESIELKREDVFIGNINRCRPPGNRQPEPDETAQCRPFILREIAVVKPKVIVVLGATAAHNLLQVKTPISRLRGNFHDYFGVKVMPTFHPAYLLRDPHKKREVWEDMKMVREFLNKSND